MVKIEAFEAEASNTDELLGIFVEEAKDHSGRLIESAVKLRKDRSDRNAIDLVYRTSHTLKGMAAILGFDTLSELASAIEKLAKARWDKGNPFSTNDLQHLTRGIESITRTIEGVKSGQEVKLPTPELSTAIGESLSSNQRPANPRMTVTSALSIDGDSVTRRA